MKRIDCGSEGVMVLFQAADRRFVEVVSQLINCNPFLPRWVELEREALGTEFREAPRFYSRRSEWDPSHLHPNLIALGERVDRLAERARQRLADGVRATEREAEVDEELAWFN